MIEKRLYGVVIDDKKYSKSYQAVQLGHAVSKLAASESNVNWSETTFLWLKVNEIEFNYVLKKLKNSNIKYTTFIEPDIGNKIIALSCLTNEYQIFKEFNLF